MALEGEKWGKQDKITFFRHPWQRIKELLAIANRSCGKKTPYSRGRVVHGLAAKVCKI